LQVLEDVATSTLFRRSSDALRLPPTTLAPKPEPPSPSQGQASRPSPIMADSRRRSDPSAVQGTLFAISAAAVPVTFALSRLDSRGYWRLKACVSGGFWAAYLGTIEALYDPMPIHRIGTMMVAVFGFMFPMKCTELIWKGTGKGAVEPDKPPPPLHVDFLRHAGNFFWLLFPVRAAVTEPKYPVLYGLECLATAAFKGLVAGPLVQGKLYQLSMSGGGDGLAGRVKMLHLFGASILCGSFINDFVSGLTSIVTLGAYEAIPFNNHPYLSASVSELWSKRYNLHVHTFLKDTTYVPARRAGFSKDSARFLTFAMSGLLHVFVARHAFRRGYFRTLAFFLSQMALIRMQEWSRKEHKDVPHWARVVETYSLFMPTLYLYGGLFVEAYPEWAENNPVQVPEFAKPFVKMLAYKMGIELESPILA